jgi:hypothetical protein
VNDFLDNALLVVDVVCKCFDAGGAEIGLVKEMHEFTVKVFVMAVFGQDSFYDCVFEFHRRVPAGVIT